MTKLINKYPRQHLCEEEEADLTLLSIVAGALEDSLTASRTISPRDKEVITICLK